MVHRNLVPPQYERAAYGGSHRNVSSALRLLKVPQFA
jgi:hypothetical protein